MSSCDEMRQHVEHCIGERLVVGLLRIEPDAAVVAYVELSSAEFLEAKNRRKVVDIGAETGARLAEPKKNGSITATTPACAIVS